MLCVQTVCVNRRTMCGVSKGMLIELGAVCAICL